MSLPLHRPVPAVPEQTELVARAAFPRGNGYLLLRDRQRGVDGSLDQALGVVLRRTQGEHRTRPERLVNVAQSDPVERLSQPPW